MGKENRIKAIEWWNNLTYKESSQLCLNYFGNDRRIYSLTSFEIERIWREETQEFHNPDAVEMIESIDMVLESVDPSWADDGSDPKPKVDFELLHSFIKKGCVTIDQKEIQSLKLFFDKMSQSSSFAHKAHKELQRLMK